MMGDLTIGYHYVTACSSKICSLAPDSNLFGKVFFSNSTCTQQSLFCWYPLSQSVVPSAREHQPICRRTSSIHCLHPVCPTHRNSKLFSLTSMGLFISARRARLRRSRLLSDYDPSAYRSYSAPIQPKNLRQAC